MLQTDRWDPISAAEFQTDRREKSGLQICAEKVEEEDTFAGAVSERVVSDLPLSPPVPPIKQACPVGVADLKSSARTIPKSIPTFHDADDSEGPNGGLVEGATPH